MPDADVAWAAREVGRDVVAREVLTGGMTSTIECLTFDDGSRAVLRVIDREPWVRHRAALVEREAATQRELTRTPVPAPRSLAADPDRGRHLMTLLPGSTSDDLTADHVERLASALADVHAVRPAVRPREYQSWAWEAKFVVPEWAEHPRAWRAAFDLLGSDPPDHDATFLHRDFQHRNVLWHDGVVSGVVDWVETSTGPAWLDVAHAATNLALHVGAEAASAFAGHYTDLTGRAADGYWEVMDVVGFLPPPGRASFWTDADLLRRLERRLLGALAAVT